MDEAERKWRESLDRRRLIGWTCSICIAVGLLTWREPIVGCDKVGCDTMAWLPQTQQAEQLPHPPEIYYSPVMYLSNASDAATGTQVIGPVGFASAESVGSLTVTSSSQVL